MGIVDHHYEHTDDLLALDAFPPHSQHPYWAPYTTPIHLPNLLPFLWRHPDQGFARYVYQGLSGGFRIGFDHQLVRLRARPVNHPSSLANPRIIDENIRVEVGAGRLIGPLPQRWSVRLHCSPLGLVPKSHTGKWRTIVDLSAPRGCSVNSGISESLCSLSYASLDNAVGLIQRLGPGTQLVKLDLKDAYRMIPVHPYDHHLLAVTWRDAIYVDRCLPFGLRSAPKIFTAVADALSWAIYCRGVRYLLHYLDDFLLIGAPESNEAAVAFSTTMDTFRELGVPVASQKTEGPATCITFLGIIVDTVSCQLRLPGEKLQRLQLLLLEWQRRKSVTLKELECLLGHLAHAATVIHPGRVFLRELFSLLSVAKRARWARLNQTARADIRWWQFFLQHWNGVSLFPPAEPSIHVFSDASGGFGCGAFSVSAGWFQLQWPPAWQDYSIAVKEMLPVVAAAANWGYLWAGAHVSFHVDNMAVVAVLQRQAPRDRDLAHLLRCLCFYAAHYQFCFSPSHIAGHLNTAADALSCNNITLFSSLFPQVPHSPVSPTVAACLLHSQPDWGSSAWTSLFSSSFRGGWQSQLSTHTNPA